MHKSDVKESPHDAIKSASPSDTHLTVDAGD